MTRYRSLIQSPRLFWAAAAAMMLIAGLLPPDPALAFPDHESYDIVLGQVRKNVRRENGIDDRSLSGPSAVAIDTSHTPNALYVADQQNARVLGWRDVTSFMDGSPPDLLIGQADKYAMERFRADAKSFAVINGLAVDKDGTLWVSDTSHGRILGFKWPFDPTKTSPNFPSADYLVGQFDFTKGYYMYACNNGYLFLGPPGSTTDQNLCGNTGIATDPDGNLYVADRDNNRVLVFKAPIAAIGAHATVLFGQPNYNVPTGGMGCNQGMGAATAKTLCRPTGVFTAKDAMGTLHLYIADSDNSRVLVFDDPLNNQIANHVFGQPNLTTGTIGNGPDRMRKPVGVAFDPKGNLWISDSAYNRVLGFSPPFPDSGAGASFIIGQVDAGSVNPNQGITGKPIPPPTATSLSGPSNMVFDAKGQLILADNNNHRVLAYDNPAQMTPAATHFLGQRDLVHGAAGRVKPSSLSYPVTVAVDRAAGEPIHVYVADFGNSRVLGWWDLGYMYDGKPADVVIGQRTLNDYACNMGSGVTAQSLCWPRGLWVDKMGNVWVADTWNNRVLRFPKPFGRATQTADLVLGQTSFLAGLPNGDGTPNLNAHSLYAPSAVVIDDNGTVWVADRDNDRVVGYQSPYANGMLATRLLLGYMLDGFTQVGCTTRPNPNASFICGPSGLALDDAGNLWVADRDNNRVSLYSTAGTGTLSPVPLAVLGQPTLASNSPNNGLMIPSAKSLLMPESVSVELQVGMDGKKTSNGIAVADTGNHRVLLYSPFNSGFQPAANRVIGQNDLFTTNMYNTDQGNFEVPANIQNGLYAPNAVLALPEALFISDSGTSSKTSFKLGAVQWASNGTGNNRVLFIKGPSFPQGGPDAAQPEDGGTAEMGAPPDLSAAADMRATATPDLAQAPPPQGHGCSCRMGGGGQPPFALVPMMLVLIGLLRRRRQARS